MAVQYNCSFPENSPDREAFAHSVIQIRRKSFQKYRMLVVVLKDYC